MTKRKKKPVNYMRQADTAFSIWVRARDKKCQNCGKKERLQCAHLISRSYKTIRCDPDNATTLCASCHVYYTHRPLEWEDWLETNHPGQYQKLKTKALTYKRINWKTEAQKWKTKIK